MTPRFCVVMTPVLHCDDARAALFCTVMTPFCTVMTPFCIVMTPSLLCEDTSFAVMMPSHHSRRDLVARPDT